MVATISCPHCDGRAVVDIPADASGVTATDQTLRFRHRDTCATCGNEFSYLTDTDS